MWHASGRKYSRTCDPFSFLFLLFLTRAALDLRPCVVVRFYDKQVNALPLLLFSLFASAHPHLKAFSSC